MIYIGAEEVISPIGNTIGANFSAIINEQTGIRSVSNAGFHGEAVFLSQLSEISGVDKFRNLVCAIFSQVLDKIDDRIIGSSRTIVILSSTKGELSKNILDQFSGLTHLLATKFNLANHPLVISNACISGVLSINAASGYIQAGFFDHAIVIGADVISDFVVYGFQSLFAISDKPCTPFDHSRNGITLGEGCGAVVVSNSIGIFKDKPACLLSGASANDANHISGPSRTGEGLFRSVKKSLGTHAIAPDEIDFICAHGTGTIYNDEMEAVAFDRLNLCDTPLNSLKGYFGHTLGAAGLIETAMSLQMLKNQVFIKSLGFQESGTTKVLNVIRETGSGAIQTILKTASGFGGGNASLIIQKL